MLLLIRRKESCYHCYRKKKIKMFLIRIKWVVSISKLFFFYLNLTNSYDYPDTET